MNELCKNQIHIAEITGYGSTGAGVCRINNRAVFVNFTIIGEVWEILILKVTSSAVYGKGIRLLKPSPSRIVPACPVFGRCGGCDLLHMTYQEELKFKLTRVNDAIHRIAGLDFSVDEILGAGTDHIFRYRNKAIYNVGQDGKGRTITGFFRERSHDIVEASDCLIQTELSVRCASALRDFMDETGIKAYDENSGEGCIRHIFTRCSLNFPQSVACIVSAKDLQKQSGELVKCLREKCPELTGIVLCINKSHGNTVLSGDFRTLWGNEYIEDSICGLRFMISPSSFYQVNPRQAERLYERVLSYASPDGTGTVLDLYCGTGTITLCLARGAKFAYGVEIVESAVLNARRNAEINGIKNAEFILGDADSAVKKLEHMNINPSAVVVDPPRKGLSENVIRTVVEMSPEHIVYVSCDPSTLARDMKLFAENGFQPEKGTAVDMFPRCAHVETVVLMSRVKD